MFSPHVFVRQVFDIPSPHNIFYYSIISSLFAMDFEIYGFFFEFSMVRCEYQAQKAVRACTIKFLILGLAKHEEGAIYKVSLLKLQKIWK